VPFPCSGNPLKRVKWLQREIEHTAALAEHQGNLSLKLKALHELGRFIWREDRLKRRQEPLDVTPELELSPEILRKFEEFRERRRAALEPSEIEKASPEVERRLQRAFELSSQSNRRSVTNDRSGNEPPSGVGFNR
jgi:hypothetical protein